MKLKLSFLAVLISIVLSATSFGALNAYLKLEGETQGEIKGSVTQAGREDSILVIAMNHAVSSPIDAASGLPSGKRQHQPLRITKEIDMSTPLLMHALVTNENLVKFELRYWQPSKTGQEVQYYTIILYDARIVGIQQEMLNNKYPENMQHREREHVSFVYGRIEWIFEDGGITAEDDWSFDGSKILVSDVNGDGIVDLADLSIISDDWLKTQDSR